MTCQGCHVTLTCVRLLLLPLLLLPLPLLRQVYAVRAEAKKRSLPAASLDLFAVTGKGAEALGDLAALTATGISSVASMFSPW